MTRQFSLVEIRRPPPRDMMVQGSQPAIEPGTPVPFGISAQVPRRAHSDVLSDSIPLYFIARNRVGLWIAREAEGRAGGIFLFKQSALRFAETSSAPHGCATMVLGEHLELDVENRGNRLVGWISAALGVVARYIPEYPPAIPTLRKNRRGEWD